MIREGMIASIKERWKITHRSVTLWRIIHIYIILYSDDDVCERRLIGWRKVRVGARGAAHRKK